MNFQITSRAGCVGGRRAEAASEAHGAPRRADDLVVSAITTWNTMEPFFGIRELSFSVFSDF